MKNLRKKYSRLLKEVKSLAPFKVDLGLILGSGLGDFANSVKIINSIETAKLSDYPQSTVEGHKGFLHFCEFEGKRFLVFQGRIHFYEGYKLEQLLLPILIAETLGVKNLLLTNAAGGVADNLYPGDIMLITSFNMMNIKKELTEVLGISDFEAKNRILSDFPSKLLTNKLINAALNSNFHLKEGVYWFNKGPSYETRAEIQMVKNFGISAVGMSTAHEAVFASMLGINVAAFSLITNFAAGISSQKLSHSEVIETAEKTKPILEQIIKEFIRLASYPS